MNGTLDVCGRPFCKSIHIFSYVMTHHTVLMHDQPPLVVVQLIILMDVIQ